MDFSASAYVRDGRFFIIGLTDSDYGPIPFAWHCECPDAPNGPVNVGAEDLHENVKVALDEADKAISSRVEQERMKLIAAELVDRARDGDQNAMALLQRIGENAKRGNPRARMAAYLCDAYIRNHPPGSFGADPGRQRVHVSGLLGTVTQAIKTRPEPVEYSSALHALLPGVLAVVDPSDAAVIVSNGPDLTDKENSRISAILAAFHSDEEKKAFVAGARTDALKTVLAKVSTNAKAACAIGYIIGLARRIQLVRLPNTPISVFSKDVAWELGD